MMVFPVVSRKKCTSPLNYFIFEFNRNTKFHFKQTILNFGTKFAPKGYFKSKTKGMNISIEFYIFELV